jgi:MYXO-CTERM domain-containing protein
MRIAHLSLVALASASIAAAANAGFTGFQAIVRDAGAGRTFVDVFAGFNTAGDRLLNVFNMNIGLTGGASFVQAAGVAASKWKPVDDTSTNNLADSFITLGGFDGGDGNMYTSYSSAGDPNFTNYTASNQTTIPALAGWYNGVPTVSDIFAVSLSSFAGDTVANSANASFGVWVAHFAFAKSATNSTANVSFSGRGAFNSGTNLLDSRIFAVGPVPAPGALALLGLAGLASRRRRA